MDLEELLALPQFSVSQSDKERWLLPQLVELQRHHAESSAPYRRLLDTLGIDVDAPIESIDQLTALPVRLFKEHDLRSIDIDDVFKVLTSSGTTGQAVSRISLDRSATQLQSRALSRVMAEVLGTRRLPMLIVDNPAVLANRQSFSRARRRRCRNDELRSAPYLRTRCRPGTR